MSVEELLWAQGWTLILLASGWVSRTRQERAFCTGSHKQCLRTAFTSAVRGAMCGLQGIVQSESGSDVSSCSYQDQFLLSHNRSGIESVQDDS